MLEIFKEINFLREITDIQAMTAGSDCLYIVSNNVNRIISINEDGDILKSMKGLKTAEYLNCSSIAFDSANGILYLALDNGTVWQKNVVNGDETLVFEKFITGLVFHNAKLFFVDDEGVLGTYDPVNDTISTHTKMEFTCSGLCYRDFDSKFITVDQTAGALVILDFNLSSEEFSEVSRQKGLFPFLSDWFSGDLAFYKDSLYCCHQDNVIKYRQSRYRFFLKKEGVFHESEILDFGEVVLGANAILECKIENIGATTMLNTGISTSGVYSVSLDGAEYLTSVTPGDIGISSQCIFWVKVVMPASIEDNVELLGSLCIDYD